jgi:hypothetical protein
VKTPFDALALPTTPTAPRSALCHPEGSDGAAAGLTTTDTGADVVCAPVLSDAVAVKAYAPAETLVHVKTNGSDVTVPIGELLAKNSTFATVPSESLAEAPIPIVAGAVNVVPFEGEIIVTAGTVLPDARDTVTRLNVADVNFVDE